MTISRTVDETSTSLGAASAATRAADVHGHAGDVVAAQLNLAGVNTHPHLDAKRRTASTIASAQSIATLGLVNVATNPSPAVFTSRPRNRASSCRDDAVVVVEQVAPPVVAECGGALGRADDIGEHDRREHAFGVQAAACAGDELLDLVEYRRGVAHPVQGIRARQLDVA